MLCLRPRDFKSTPKLSCGSAAFCVTDDTNSHKLPVRGGSVAAGLDSKSIEPPMRPSKIAGLGDLPFTLSAVEPAISYRLSAGFKGSIAWPARI